MSEEEDRKWRERHRERVREAKRKEAEERARNAVVERDLDDVEKRLWAKLDELERLEEMEDRELLGEDCDSKENEGREERNEECEKKVVVRPGVREAAGDLSPPVRYGGIPSCRNLNVVERFKRNSLLSKKVDQESRIVQEGRSGQGENKQCMVELNSGQKRF